MGLAMVYVVGHLASSWQQLQHQVPYKPDSTHEQLEEVEEEVEEMKVLEVSLLDFAPMQPEPQVLSQNESLTY